MDRDGQELEDAQTVQAGRPAGRRLRKDRLRRVVLPISAAAARSAGPLSVVLQGVLAVAGTVLLLVGGVAVGRRVLRKVQWNRPVELLPEPVPDGWAEIVRRHFPLAAGLQPTDFERLLKLVQVFLRQKRIDGAGGLEVTEEMRVTIAAQACFLILWLNIGLYPRLETVIVYPSTVVPRDARQLARLRTFGAVSPAQPIVGESWGHGIVILSWDRVEHGAEDPRDGRNVVFHEFAHQLDQDTGEADGIPVGLGFSNLKPWAHVIERELGRLEAAVREGSESVLDAYGATNKAEFFAVATETFFEKPKELRSSEPDLYAILSDFYGVDPATGLTPLRDPTRSADPPRGHTAHE